MAFGFFQPDEEQVAEFRAAQDRQRMEYDVTVHGINRFLTELSVEDARFLQIMLSAIANNADPVATCNFYIGILAHKMYVDGGICIAHRVNHDDEIEQAANAPAERGEEMTTDPPESPPPDPPDDAGPGAPDHDPAGDVCLCGDFRVSHLTDSEGHTMCMSCFSCDQFVLASTT